MNPSLEASYKKTVQNLLTLNFLQVKAFEAETLQSLIFIIVNDTYQVFPYDRAILWELRENSMPKLAGISGAHKVYKESELNQKWSHLLSKLNNPEMPQVLNSDSFRESKEVYGEIVTPKETLIYWIPIKIDSRLTLGLALEIWKPQERQINTKADLTFLTDQVVRGYSAAWAKFEQRRFVKPHFFTKNFLISISIFAVLMLFAVRVPLRIAAPCEIVPKDPILITAPLDGIVQKLVIKPGTHVHKGEILLQYDKTIPMEELQAAEKQVKITEAELDKSSVLGLSDSKQLADLEILRFKLEKDKLMLNLAQTQTSKLEVKAPEDGIVMIDDPDSWRGKPVRIGEKIMTLSNSKSSKVKLWIPEEDNIPLDQAKPISIILNINPRDTLEAKLSYISFESGVGEGETVSFLAEADWQTPPKDARIGLRGTAILYGDNVSLFYFIIRKPWSAFRRLTGF